MFWDGSHIILPPKPGKGISDISSLIPEITQGEINKIEYKSTEPIDIEVPLDGMHLEATPGKCVLANISKIRKYKESSSST